MQRYSNSRSWTGSFESTENRNRTRSLGYQESVEAMFSEISIKRTSEV